ncbi:MAG: glycoside hydrolase family 3 N-terminal domain-containing protein [Saccharofermentanales bacterium]
MTNFWLIPDNEKRIDDLIENMTLEEKIGQMTQLSPSIVGGFDLPFPELIEMLTEGRISQEEFKKIMQNAEMDYREDQIRAGKIGSFLLNNPTKANELQRIAVEESRLGIPLIFGFDVIHGFKTVFPIPLAEACIWDEDIFTQSARISAQEARSHNIHWAFSPMLDVARDARWGRIAESPGEDPYLASVYARAKVRGLQGNKPDAGDNVAACLKHYIAYGAAEGGQDYNTVSMADSLLCNIYLPPFQAGVAAGAATVMSAFNDYNGVPCTINKFLLRDLLKERLGFAGFVVSDANSIDDCIRHGSAVDLKEAALKSCLAGLDMDMNSHAYSTCLKKQVEEGDVPPELLDDAVRRILRIKMGLGLFDNPYVSEEKISLYNVLPDEHVRLARETARRSIVLLKNEEDILPISENCRVALIGELADLPEEVVGSWAMGFNAADCVSIRQGLLNAGIEVFYEKTCGVTSPFDPDALQRAAERADVIVAVVGELISMSGEAASRADISLPGQQEIMLKAALNTGKPVIVILMNGRPLAIPWLKAHMPVIVEAWQLGIQMGNAVADVLLGYYNPSGKLSCTFPAQVGQCPRYYNHPSTGRPGAGSKFSSRYLDAPLEPLFPFGFGLSYTTFSYADLIVEQTTDQVLASVEVTNTGKYPGEETVQLYIQDIAASLVRPVKELKAFTKVLLQPGQKATVDLAVPKARMGFYDNAMVYRLEDGAFNIYVGANSRDCLQKSIDIAF